MALLEELPRQRRRRRYAEDSILTDDAGHRLQRRRAQRGPSSIGESARSASQAGSKLRVSIRIGLLTAADVQVHGPFESRLLAGASGAVVDVVGEWAKISPPVGHARPAPAGAGASPSALPSHWALGTTASAAVATLRLSFWRRAALSLARTLQRAIAVAELLHRNGSLPIPVL